jgi:hypothetical protein
MKQHRTLAAGSHNFVVDIASDPRHIDQAARPFIRARIHREDKPEQAWNWEGYLLPEMNVAFELRFKDQVNIKGHFTALHPDGLNYDDIILNASFGQNLDNQYEGKLLKS